MAATNEKSEKVPIEQEHIETAADVGNTQDARAAAEAEHETTFWQALKSNKKAALWSIALSSTIIMEGYDIGMHCLPITWPARGTLIFMTCRSHISILRLPILR